MSVSKITLSNDVQIPQIGLGLWLNKDEQICKAAVKYALDAGYRHFDTAQAYGNEAFLGAGLQENSIGREELFITTKISNDNQWWKDIMLSFDAFLRVLQMQYVDLLLLHFPVTETRRPAWHKMEEIYNSGRAKAIGVSNYTVRHLEELLLECSVKPMVNQVELHIFLQQPELVKYCRQNEIVLEAYSPLAHGHRMNDSVIVRIADKHHKTTAQIMIRWAIEQGLVVLPKSTHKERIEENINVFDFVLDDQDQLRLKELDRNLRTCWDPTHVP